MEVGPPPPACSVEGAGTQHRRICDKLCVNCVYCGPPVPTQYLQDISQ